MGRPRSKRSTQKKETSLNANFLNGIFGNALGYDPIDKAVTGKYTLEREFPIPGIGAVDGALGYFPLTTDHPLPVAVIELKGPETDLDTHRSNGRTAVNQLFDYLNALPATRWGIVSNISPSASTKDSAVSRSMGVPRTHSLNITEGNHMIRKILYGMTPCRVEQLSFGPWLVTFAEARQLSLLLQIDYDRAVFAVKTGAINAPTNWNGTVESLGPDWESFDPEIIEFCPVEYLSV
jgi:hypothetical protein